MDHNTSRRRFLGKLAAAGALLPLMRISAAGLPHLSPSSPEAQAMHYTDDHTKLSPKTESIYKPGSHCGICNFYQGGTNAYGACPIFPGHQVHINGWCESFSHKS